MNLEEFLGKTVTIKIDRPMGSRHPRKGFIYPVNYGFVPNTKAPDGDEIDAYVLGIFEPMEEFTGACIAIVHREDDDDDKLVLAPKEREFSDEQITALTEFQERFFKSVIIR
jgi:inorganic pyrophosphatase